MSKMFPVFRISQTLTSIIHKHNYVSSSERDRPVQDTHTHDCTHRVGGWARADRGMHYKQDESTLTTHRVSVHKQKDGEGGRRRKRRSEEMRL